MLYRTYTFHMWLIKLYTQIFSVHRNLECRGGGAGCGGAGSTAPRFSTLSTFPPLFYTFYRATLFRTLFTAPPLKPLCRPWMYVHILNTTPWIQYKFTSSIPTRYKFTSSIPNHCKFTSCIPTWRKLTSCIPTRYKLTSYIPTRYKFTSCIPNR